MIKTETSEFLLIPPMQLVDRSYSAYWTRSAVRSANPTNAVGGSFIPGLLDPIGGALRKSHQRSWWIVHTQPMVDAKLGRSDRAPRFKYEQSTNCVGGIWKNVGDLSPS